MLWTLVIATTALAGDLSGPCAAMPEGPVRVGGDLEIQVTERAGPEGPLYVSGGVFTDTKLPVGYPRPTPPGAIEIKDYPVIRQAEVSGKGRPAEAGNLGFWPLFQHISRNDIAMTAPVEMRYSDADGDTRPDRWTMAFLYHVPENGPVGEDGQVVVVDTEPVTVLSIGVMGGDRTTDLSTHVAALQEWLEASEDWEPAGDLRALGYNGPNVRPANRWWEVQIPIRPVQGDE